MDIRFIIVLLFVACQKPDYSPPEPKPFTYFIGTWYPEDTTTDAVFEFYTVSEGKLGRQVPFIYTYNQEKAQLEVNAMGRVVKHQLLETKQQSFRMYKGNETVTYKRQ